MTSSRPSRDPSLLAAVALRVLIPGEDAGLWKALWRAHLLVDGKLIQEPYTFVSVVERKPEWMDWATLLSSVLGDEVASEISWAYDGVDPWGSHKIFYEQLVLLDKDSNMSYQEKVYRSSVLTRCLPDLSLRGALILERLRKDFRPLSLPVQRGESFPLLHWNNELPSSDLVRTRTHNST